MRQTEVFIFLLLLLAIPVAAAFDVARAQATNEMKTINPIADSFVVDSDPDWNRGREQKLLVTKGPMEDIAFLMFDLRSKFSLAGTISSIPSKANIQWAKLRLYARIVFRSTPLSLHYCPDNGWTEDEITYNNRPAFSSVAIDTVNVTTLGGWYEWNATATLKAALEATDKRLSLVLKAEAENKTWVEFYSRGKPDAQPQLVVSYSTPPATGLDSAQIAIAAIVSSGLATGLAMTYRRFREKHEATISR